MKSTINNRLLIIFLLTVFIAMCVSTIGCDNLPAEVDPIDDNYRVFYQIFVGSFSDSDGDGIGDIRGIIDRFDYLNDGNINSGKSLGVQGIWLSPIFLSPSYHKYDCSDYYQIDPDFGTQEDLEELIELCHSRNVKIILDLVLNHTSTSNQWFQKFVAARKSGNASDKYYDYYSTSKDNTYNVYNQVYYECNFDTGMPELNYDNQEVRSDMLDVAKYYLDMGIDGFRFDAIKYIYYGQTAKSAEFWDWYMGELREVKPDIYTVGECWSADAEVVEYYGALDCFNFTSSQAEGYIAAAARNGRIDNFTSYIEGYLDTIKGKRSDAMYMPFLSNHDTDRAAGYVTISTGDAYMAANLYILCSGSPMIYYGEEIGMKGSRGSANTDANRRLAMLWGDGDTVKDPVGTTFNASSQINGTVKEQLKDKDSLLNYYSRVIAMRNKYPAIARGDYKALKTDNDETGGFIITYGDKSYVLLHNTSRLDTASVDLPDGYALIADYIGRGSAKIKDGKLVIGPQTSVILEA